MAKLAHPTPSLASVFDQLLGAIVSGRYPPGTRLPGERDLARTLGASRPTLREALRRLGAWGLIEVRRGSGVLVRELADWSFDVLPAYIRLGRPADVVPMIGDLLAVRRVLLVDILRLVAPRLPAAALDELRAAAARAWAARAELGAFLREDFALVRAIPLAARFLPALWMLNGLTRVYLDLAATIQGPAMVPDSYLDTYRAVFDTVAAGKPEQACALLATYLEEHDRRLLGHLGSES
jgi:DNA-binding FadR family transcriptional regulator